MKKQIYLPSILSRETHKQMENIVFGIFARYKHQDIGLSGV